MATVLDAVVAQIVAQYGGTGAGGATPDNIKNLYDYRTQPPFTSGDDSVLVYKTRAGTRKPFNENYATITTYVTILCATSEDDDRLKTIADEVVRVINTYAITGVNVQYVEGFLDVSIREDRVYAMELYCVLQENMAASAAAYDATAATSHVHDGATLEHDAVDSDGGAFSFTTTGAVSFNQAVKNAADDSGVYTGADDDLRMYHSGTAGYLKNDTGDLYIRNLGTRDILLDCGDVVKFRDYDDAYAVIMSVDTTNRDLNIGTAADVVEIKLNNTTTIDAIKDEDDMASDSATALATQQSIKKYVDDNAGGGGVVTADYFHLQVANGASQNDWYGPHIYMPNADNNCEFRLAFRVPDDWPGAATNAYITLKYLATVASTAYSCVFYCASHGTGDNANTDGWDVLSADNTQDFAGTAQYIVTEKKVDISTGWVAGDICVFKCISDASNGTALRIFGAWFGE